METICLDQAAFQPTRLTLDNMMLTQEALDWAKTSNQPLIFLRLHFAKAYDKVDWQFMLLAMEKFGILEEFIRMTKLLLLDASASVKVNGNVSDIFPIGRGVRQGCPLAPYLLLIVAEVLNVMDGSRRWKKDSY